MEGLQGIGKLLIIAGIVLALIGGLIMLSGRLPWIGRLPGDIVIQKKNFSFYFPITTSILLSLVISLIIWFIGRR